MALVCNAHMPSHLRRYDEPGHIHFLTISCHRRLPFFRNAAARDIVVECMNRSRQRLGFRWIGYVIMPEHVHWLCFPHPRGSETLIPISNVLESLKTSIGKQIKSYLRGLWTERRTLGDSRLDNWALAPKGSKPIWTRRGIDTNVTIREHPIRCLDYCHANPVKRGLADRAELWR